MQHVLQPTSSNPPFPAAASAFAFAETEAVDGLLRVISTGGGRVHLDDLTHYWRARGHDATCGPCAIFVRAHPDQFSCGADGVVQHAATARLPLPLPRVLSPHAAAVASGGAGAGGGSLHAVREELVQTSRQLCRVRVAPAATSPPHWPDGAPAAVSPRSPPTLPPFPVVAAAPVAAAAPPALLAAEAGADGGENRWRQQHQQRQQQQQDEEAGAAVGDAAVADAVADALAPLLALHAQPAVEEAVAAWLRLQRACCLRPVLSPPPPPPPSVLPDAAAVATAADRCAIPSPPETQLTVPGLADAAAAAPPLPAAFLPPPVLAGEAAGAADAATSVCLSYIPHKEWCGVVRWLRDRPAGGGRALRCPRVSAAASSVGAGEAADVVACEPRPFSTADEAAGRACVVVALGGVAVVPSYYTLAFSAPDGVKTAAGVARAPKPRCWLLEGSLDGVTFVPLSEHANDDAFGPADRTFDVVASFRIHDAGNVYAHPTRLPPPPLPVFSCFSNPLSQSQYKQCFQILSHRANWAERGRRQSAGSLRV